MRTLRALLASGLLILLAAPAVSAQATVARPQGAATSAGAASPGVFVVEPYLQLGDAPARGVSNSLQLLWHAADADDEWMVDYHPGDDQEWRRAEAPAWRRIAVGAVPPHRIHQAALTGLKPGSTVA